MATEIILRQVLIFGILIGLGALAYWRKIITPEMKNNLASIVVDLTLPFLIFSTFAKMKYDPVLIKNGLIVFALAYLNFFILFWIGKLSSKLLRLNNAQEAVHTLHTMFGNVALFGFPLLEVLFPGGIGIFYGALYQLASNSTTFTYSVYRLSSGTSKSGLRSLVNNNTIALLFGTIVLLTGINLPSFLKVPFENLGRCTSPLSMVYIGATLASMNIKKMLSQKSIYVLTLNRLLLGPLFIALVYILAFKVLGVHPSREAYFVSILQSSMPCQTIVVVLSQRYNGDYQLASANLFVTTLLSILSLPVIFLVLEKLWQFLGAG